MLKFHQAYLKALKVLPYCFFSGSSAHPGFWGISSWLCLPVPFLNNFFWCAWILFRVFSVCLFPSSLHFWRITGFLFTSTACNYIFLLVHIFYSKEGKICLPVLFAILFDNLCSCIFSFFIFKSFSLLLSNIVKIILINSLFLS